MGSYDTVTLYGDNPKFITKSGDRPTCFQTKDLGEGYGAFVIIDGILYDVGEQKDPVVARTATGNDPLYLKIERSIKRSHLTKTFNVYEYIEDERPILSMEPPSRTVFGDAVREHGRFVEFDVTVHDGRVTDVSIVHDESKEDVVAKLRLMGADVLDDDDRMAKRHFARKEAEKKR